RIESRCFAPELRRDPLGRPRKPGNQTESSRRSRKEMGWTHSTLLGRNGRTVGHIPLWCDPAPTSRGDERSCRTRNGQERCFGFSRLWFGLASRCSYSGLLRRTRYQEGQRL